MNEVPKAMRNRCPSTRGHLPAVVCGRTGGAGERGLASAPRARAILAVSRADSLVQSTNTGAPGWSTVAVPSKNVRSNVGLVSASPP